MGPPVIKGFVKKHGHDFDQIDLNIGFLNFVRQKIDMRIISNPMDQQNPKEVENLLLMYFTDRFVTFQASRSGYASEYLKSGTNGEITEHLNPEVGTGLGYNGIVNSSHQIISRFTRDRELNYFHQFLDETNHPGELARNYTIIGFSIIGPSQFIPALTLAHRIKDINPEARIVLGGPWTTLFAPELAEARELYPFYDMIVQGEGELPFLKILQAGPGLKSETIPNLWMKNADGFIPPDSGYRTDMNELSPPDYNGLDLDSYGAPKPVMVQGSRGCYWGRCAFCVHATGVHNHQSGRIRLRSFDKLAEDIDHLIRTYSPRFISFADVSVSPSEMKKLCHLFLEKAYQLPWFVFLRFENGFDRDLLKLMREAGCFLLNFGLESGSKRILKLIDKGHDLDTAKRILQDATELGFRVSIHTMAGLPGETDADLKKTIHIIKEFIPGIHESYTEIFRLEKNTRIYQEPEKYGIDLVSDTKVFDNAIPFNNRFGLDRNDALKIINQELYPFYFKHNNLIYRRKSIFSLKHKNDFTQESIFHAAINLAQGTVTYQDEVTVSTRGGGLLWVRNT